MRSSIPGIVNIGSPSVVETDIRLGMPPGTSWSSQPGNYYSAGDPPTEGAGYRAPADPLDAVILQTQVGPSSAQIQLIQQQYMQHMTTHSLFPQTQPNPRCTTANFLDDAVLGALGSNDRCKEDNDVNIVAFQVIRV